MSIPKHQTFTRKNSYTSISRASDEDAILEMKWVLKNNNYLKFSNLM